VGWGVPFSDALHTDTARQLMQLAVQVLVILLDYGHPMLPPAPASAGAEAVGNGGAGSAGGGLGLPYVRPGDEGAAGFNVFRMHFRSV
jgi:hypothetical protein